MSTTVPLRKTRAYIDLEALASNFRLLSTLACGAGLMPCVKADAYGHGMIAIARICEQEGAPFIAVATLEEGAELVKNNIRVPVLILQDLFPDEIDAALHLGLRLACGSLEYAQTLSHAARVMGCIPKLHVNIDTGMGRIGLHDDDPTASLKAILSLPHLEIEGVFSHFSTSDESDKTFAFQQIERFQAIREALGNQGIRPAYFHMANSGALLDFPAASRFDLVRPGIALYGLHPSGDVQQHAKLKPVMSVASRIIRINDYARPWDIGYGRTYKAKPGTRIAIVPIGYGDGYPRGLSNRAHALCHGKRVPLAGRISMDMLALDVTALGTTVCPGDEVILLGSQRAPDGTIDTITAEELARMVNTISYEIICGFLPRVPRIYTA